MSSSAWARAKAGLELYMLRVVRWLSASQLDCVTVVAPGGALASLLEAEGLPYRRLAVTLRWFPFVAARRLARWIDREGIDVIHVHWGKDLSLVVLARRLARRPARIVVSRQMALTRPKHDWYHRALYHHVDPMLVITRRLEREALRYLPLPSERIQLLYHGVAAPPLADPRSCAELRERAGIPPGVAVIGTEAGGVPEIIDHERTGLLVPPRDPAALAEAIERLERDPGLRTRLAASGKASADARFNEEQHFDRLVAFLGGNT